MNTQLSSPGAVMAGLEGSTLLHKAGRRRPYVIAIANQKGGVAKTTTTVSLGGALHRQGQEVLLVDLDPQANLSLALGVDPGRVTGGTTEVLLESAGLAGVSRETRLPGLDLAPANPALETAERFLPLRQDYELRLKAALSARLPYDFILLDCPPALGAVTLNALCAADLLIIPTQAEFFSIHALRSMMASIRRVRAGSNPGLLYRILITLQDRRIRVHRQLSEQVRATFGAGVFTAVIETDTRIRESAAAGVPVTEYSPKSRSALQYTALAEEVRQYVPQKNTV